MKKNFFKKLSFILALAMIVTALAPASGVFAAAKAPKLSATSKTLHLSGISGANKYDFNISNKQSGWKYLWKSSNADVVSVNKSNGLTTAKGAGTAKVSVVISDKSGEEVDTLTASVLVRDNISKLTITHTPAGDKLAVGAENDFNRSYVTEAGLTKGSQAITRWTTDEGATISDVGLFVASKAGEYTITARSFQSKEKYNLWLSDNVANAKYVTATATYKVTVAPSMVKVEQVDLDTFKVTFDSAVEDVATKLALKSVVGSVNVNELIKSVSLDADKKVATVDVFVPFKAGTTYVVSYPEMADLQFVGATQKAEDVVRIDILTSAVEIGKNKTLDIALYDKNGVNIANDDLLSHVDIDVPNDQNAYENGARDIIMYQLGATATVVATFHTWNYDNNGLEVGALTASKVITCVDQSTESFSTINAYTIDKNDVVEPDFVNNLKKSISLSDTNKKLFVELKGKDASGNDKTIDNGISDGNWKFTSNDETVLYVGETTGNLSPLKAGAAAIIVYYDGKAIGNVPVTVTPKRELSTVALSTGGVALSNAAFGDTASVSVTSHKDQLGEDADYDMTVRYAGGKTEPAGLLSYTHDEITFLANPSIDPGTYNYTVTFSDVNNSDRKFVRNIQVSIQEPRGAATYWKIETDKLVYDMKVTSSDPEEEVVVSVYGYASNNVKAEKIDLSAATPDYAVSIDSSNDTEPTLALAGGNGTFDLVTTSPSAISAVSGGALYAKLKTGQYRLTATPKSGLSRATVYAYFTVTDTQAKPVLTVNKNYSNKDDIGSSIKDCISLSLDGHSILSELPDTADLDYYKFDFIDTDAQVARVKEIYYYQQVGSAYIKHTITAGFSVRYNQDRK